VVKITQAKTSVFGGHSNTQHACGRWMRCAANEKSHSPKEPILVCAVSARSTRQHTTRRPWATARLEKRWSCRPCLRWVPALPAPSVEPGPSTDAVARSSSALRRDQGCPTVHRPSPAHDAPAAQHVSSLDAHATRPSASRAAAPRSFFEYRLL
jgi:hypothetical protein